MPDSIPDFADLFFFFYLLPLPEIFFGVAAYANVLTHVFYFLAPLPLISIPFI